MVRHLNPELGTGIVKTQFAPALVANRESNGSRPSLSLVTWVLFSRHRKFFELLTPLKQCIIASVNRYMV